MRHFGAAMEAGVGMDRLPEIIAYAKSIPLPERKRGDNPWSDWQPAGPDDSRGPCPVLNSLANHGFLNRNGRGITVAQLISGAYKGAGMGPVGMGVIGMVGIVTTQPLGTIELDLMHLGNHGALEHDVSLSRVDASQGDSNNFNATQWARTLSHIPESATHWDSKSAMAAHYDLLQLTKKQTPDTVQGPIQWSFQIGEISAVSLMLGDWVAGNPRIDWLRIVFEEERLPYNEGWRPHTTWGNFSRSHRIPSTNSRHGSTSRWLVPGKEINNPFDAAIQFPGSAVATGFQSMTGVVDFGLGAFNHLLDTPQWLMGRLAQGAPWKGREARIGSPIRGGHTVVAKDTSIEALLGIPQIAGVAQQAVGGLASLVTSIPGYLVGGTIGAGKDIADGFVPYLGAQVIKSQPTKVNTTTA
ncbi:hypothetical protein RQP46_001246 [Phenoliferia psychrophenolica]